MNIVSHATFSTNTRPFTLFNGKVPIILLTNTSLPTFKKIFLNVLEDFFRKRLTT